MKTTTSFNEYGGGVHPQYHKLTADSPSRLVELPAKLCVSMSQHLGAPAAPVVKVGDTVLAGQLIGGAVPGLSANVHSPVGGKVTQITQTISAAGRPSPAVEIAVDPEVTETAFMEPIDWENASVEVLLERIKDAGCTGMGGAGFPTHIKLNPPKEKHIDTLILNGAECEPWLTSDHRVMVEQAEMVRLGCRIIRKILNVERVRIAIEANKPLAIAAMEKAFADSPGDIEICVLPTRYPMGGEKQQIYAITGREVPQGGLPMDVGCLVENIGTTLAVKEAIVFGRPLIWRRVTVTGDAVTEPSNLIAPIGMSYDDLIAACGGYKGRVAKLISGGPMMGFAVASGEVTMTKTTSGVLALSRELTTAYRSQPCISCGRCLEACPMHVEPAELSQFVEADDMASAEAQGVLNCCECGCCAFVCPSHRPLVQHFRRAKAAIMAHRAAERAAAVGK